MRSFLFVALLFLGSFAYSQNDTLFWFAAPKVTEAHADRPVFFRVVTTDKPSRLLITFPAQGVTLIDTLISPNDVFSYRIDDPDFIELDFEKENKGLKIESDVPVSIYYEVEAGGFNTDIYALKGNNALGKKFKIPLQKVYPNRVSFFARNSVQIVATEDSTLVTIIPSPTGVGGISVLLNEGETYLFSSQNEQLNTRLSGSTISATKPIAVSITDDSVVEGNNYDLIGDQLIPMEFAGALYALPEGEVTFTSLTATSITIGSETIILNASNNFTLSKTVPIAILAESTEPVVVNYVDKVSNNFGAEFGGAILPPLSCSGSSEVAFTRNNVSQRFFLYLVFRTSAINDFTLDENPFLINNQLVTQLDSNLSFIKLETFNDEISRGNHRMKNSTAPFHLAIGGGSISTGYQLGYFSNFRTEIEDTIPLCDFISTPEELLSEINLFGEVTLDTLEERTDSTFLKITVKDEYCVTEDSAWVLQLERPLLTLPDSIVICKGVDSLLILDANRVIFNTQETDTFKVQGEEITAYIENEQGCSATKKIAVNIVDSLKFFTEADSVFCDKDEGEVVFFSQNLDSITVNGITLNSTLNELDTIRTLEDTVFNVSLKNICNEVSTQFVLTKIELPIINLGEDREICSFNNAIFLPQAYSYTWHDESKDTIYSVYESGLHIVEATNAQGCTFTDSVLIIYKDIDSLKTIPDAIVCSGKTYDVFIDPNFDTYTWNDGIDTNVRFLNSGDYELEIITNVNDTLCYRENSAFNVSEFQLTIPNVITPNDDGLNDDFVTLGVEGTDNIELDIVNRWGKTIHTTDSFNGTWTPSPEINTGVYYYKTTSLVHECLNLKGWMTILK